MWNKLSMSEKAKIIKMGVDSGLTHLNHIKEAYNSFAEGGYKDRPDIENYLREKYSTMDTSSIRVIEDDNYRPEGYGNIETMKKEDAWYPDINYTYKNPYPDNNTIVFNDNVRDPYTAAYLDALHVFRDEDPKYKELLSNIQNATSGTDIERWAQDDYRENPTQPYERKLENAVDDYLRLIFHPGTQKEMAQDNYFERREIWEDNKSLQNPTKELYSYLHPTELDEIEVIGNRK